MFHNNYLSRLMRKYMKNYKVSWTHISCRSHIVISTKLRAYKDGTTHITKENLDTRQSNTRSEPTSPRWAISWHFKIHGIVALSSTPTKADFITVDRGAKGVWFNNLSMNYNFKGTLKIRTSILKPTLYYSLIDTWKHRETIKPHTSYKFFYLMEIVVVEGTNGDVPILSSINDVATSTLSSRVYHRLCSIPKVKVVLTSF